MKIIDLSIPIVNGTDWYNDTVTPPVSITNVGSIEENGWISHKIAIQVLNGTTYIETAGHLFPDGGNVDCVPLDRLICRVHLIRTLQQGTELLPPKERLTNFRAGIDALIIWCGWDAHLSSSDYYAASPHFSIALQQWILGHSPFILGADVPSFDRPDDAEMPFLHEYFRRGGIIVAPLINLGEVTRENVTLCIAPLKLTSVNAAPCRAFAIIEQAE